MISMNVSGSRAWRGWRVANVLSGRNFRNEKVAKVPYSCMALTQAEKSRPTSTRHQFTTVAHHAKTWRRTKAGVADSASTASRVDSNFDASIYVNPNYPIHDPKHPEYSRILEQVHAELDHNGCAVLKDFFAPDAMEVVVRQSLESAKTAHKSDNTHNPYLEDDDDAFPKGHIRRRQVHSAKTCIAYDEIEFDSPLSRLYNWDPLTRFVQAALQEPSLHLTADELGALNVHVYAEGEELSWHYDRGNFAITLLLQRPNGGGAFEFSPNLRTDNEENYDLVEQVIDGKAPHLVESLKLYAGDLILFRGHYSLHRVTPPVGDKERIIAILSYDREPNTHLNSYTRQKFFGR